MKGTSSRQKLHDELVANVPLTRLSTCLVGALITTPIYFVTGTMLLSTPGATIECKGLHSMNSLGLSLFKDVMSFGVSLYFISYHGQTAMLAESRTNA
ncbi:hypothetical protein [Acidisarcina polymorpha]|nr:hypothetical protein [Acidisarcina polymorpha]